MKTLTLPGSKSITNRDLILAGLTSGKTILKGCLESKDTKYMIQALREFGIEINDLGNYTLEINGGVEKLKAPDKDIFLGQSGTCLRFLLGIAILVCDKEITFTGEQRLLERPLKDLFDGIEQLGINVDYKSGEYVKMKPSLLASQKPSPLHQKPSPLAPLPNGEGNIGNIPKIKMNGNSSSQFFTSLLQVAPVLEKGLEIEVVGDLVSKPYIDITTNEMAKFGVKVENRDYKYFKVEKQIYTPIPSPFPSKEKGSNREIIIEGDASALSYIACYIALHGGEIKINNIGKNSKQGDYKFLDSMKIFGLEYSDGETTILKSKGIQSRECRPAFPTEYKDYKIDFEDMPDVSMSFMIMSIFLPGITTINGLKTLNLKECLRIDAMRDELRKLGVQVESDSESISIGDYNCRDKKSFVSTEEKIKIETYNDHRIAMCFGILNTFIGGLNILNPECVSKTYPEFWKDLEMLAK